MPDDPSTAFTVQAGVAEDKRSAVLEIIVDGKTQWTAIADAEAIERVINTLGASRAHMLEPVPNDMPEGTHPNSAFDPRWYVLPDSENRFATLWIRHPGLGWSGYGFSRTEAASIAQWLRRIPQITTVEEKLASLPAHASSFGGEDFLVTTTGLGFYHYGKGEKRIGPNPFEQVEFDSDRAAGIVAGSIVDIRLEEALRNLMKQDNEHHKTIAQNLFRPSGSLGPFSAKIDVAYLIGILSEEAYKDSVILKGIRNDFAHELECDSFDIASIRDRCKNFSMVDRHVGPVPSFIESDVTPPDRSHPYLGLPNFREKLADPRFRYTMTAQLLSFRLGQGADDADHTLPLI